MTGLPTVRVDDILVHPRDNDLIVGTHGRGIYIIDDITPLQQLSEKATNAPAHLFETRPAVQWHTDVTLSRYIGGAKLYRALNPQPGTAISYYLKSTASEDVKITISDATGRVVRTMNGPKGVGINRVQWNLRGEVPQRFANQPGAGGPPVGPGTYMVKLQVGDKEFTTPLVVEADTYFDR
jgi:hypothetical protein